METNFDLVSSLAQLNLAYLGIVLGSLTLILGGLFLFSVSPIRENMKRQEKLLLDLKDEIAKKIEKFETDTINSIKSDFDRAIDNSKVSFQSVFMKELEKTKNSFTEDRISLLKELDNKIENFKKSDISFIKEALVKNESVLRDSQKSFQNHLDNLKNLTNSNKSELSDSKYKIKELEAFMYSQKGKMGGIIGQVDLLADDLSQKRWNLASRLSEIKKELDETSITPELATKLRELLKQINEEGYVEIIENVKKAITVKT